MTLIEREALLYGLLLLSPAIVYATVLMMRLVAATVRRNLQK